MSMDSRTKGPDFQETYLHRDSPVHKEDRLGPFPRAAPRSINEGTDRSSDTVGGLVRARIPSRDAPHEVWTWPFGPDPFDRGRHAGLGRLSSPNDRGGPVARRGGGQAGRGSTHPTQLLEGR